LKDDRFIKDTVHEEVLNLFNKRHHEVDFEVNMKASITNDLSMVTKLVESSYGIEMVRNAINRADMFFVKHEKAGLGKWGTHVNKF
jgi:hypothetical protein